MLHRIILSEELGHYFTTIGNNTPKKYIKYSDKLKIDICEEKVIRWALNFLVPTQALLDFLQQHEYLIIDDCCTHFDVPMELISKKFETTTQEGISWKHKEPTTFSAHIQAQTS